MAAALFAGGSASSIDKRSTVLSTSPSAVLRLSLSLGSASRLLDVPWELLFVPPLFLASQQRTPIVRVIESDRPIDPAVVDGAYRILGVVASPAGLAPLDVTAERAQVEEATVEHAVPRSRLGWTGCTRRHRRRCAR